MFESTRITDTVSKLGQRFKPQAPGLKDAECERVRENFKTIVCRAGDNIRDPQGDWPPLLLLERDGRIITQCLDGYDLNSTEAKNYLANVALPAIIREHEPKVAGLAVHCWTVAHVADPYLDVHTGEHGTIANHPSRTECLTLLVVDDDENIEGWVAPVTRRQRRPPKLGPWTGGDTVDGRFATPLQKAMAGEPILVSGGGMRPAKGVTMEFYRLLFEATVPQFGDETTDNILLLACLDGLKTLDWEAFTDLYNVDQEAALRLLVQETGGLQHLALVLAFPRSSEWADSNLGRLFDSDELVAITVADEVGISVAAASISRDDGYPQVDRWAHAAEAPSDEPLLQFIDYLRQLIV